MTTAYLTSRASGGALVGEDGPVAPRVPALRLPAALGPDLGDEDAAAVQAEIDKDDDIPGDENVSLVAPPTAPAVEERGGWGTWGRRKETLSRPAEAGVVGRREASKRQVPAPTRAFADEDDEA